MSKNKTSARGLLFFALIFSVLLMAFVFTEADAYGQEQQTGTVNISALNVRSGPGTLNEALGLIYSGDKVTILGTETDYTGMKWYSILYNGKIGFVSADYIVIDSNNVYVYDPAFESELTAQGFPESYKPYLRQLHADYPSWIFNSCRTGIDWNAAVERESVVGTTLVSGTSPASWKSMEKGAYNFDTGNYINYDSGNWVTASRPIVEHYMDPRNFLNSAGVFQFLAHSYDGRSQTPQGLAALLDGTFMGREFPEDGYATYNEVLMEAGIKAGVNPYVLASMILVEQGSSGVGKSISGTVSGYEGFYNHFNVGAYASGGMDAVTRGLWYASGSGSYSRPWDSRYKSIIGGAEFYGANYVSNNKYTLYLKKFNVMNGQENVGTGQYMTNVQGAESEAAQLRKGYISVLNNPMTFIVPVYENMPETACLKPVSSANNNNFLTALSVSGYDLTPVFNRYQTEYELVVDEKINSINVTANTSSTSAKVSGLGNINLKSTTTDVKITVTAPSGVKRTYTITVSKSASGQIGKQPVIGGAYTLGDDLRGVSFNTSYSNFIKNIKVENGRAELVDSDGKIISSGTVGTGMILKIYDLSENLVGTYDVVILGDCNGDGKVSSVDPLILQKHIVGSRSIKGAALKAADINGDSRVNSLDVLYMQKHIVGSYSIVN